MIKTFYFQNNKLLIKFFEWLYFSEYEFYGKKCKIVYLISFRTFLCDDYNGRVVITPIWNKERIFYLIKRLLGRNKNED